MKIPMNIEEACEIILRETRESVILDWLLTDTFLTQ